ncbi:NAD(P)-dependent dehydrogenase (short-subunit alcohol dehydrogenase family) [Bradyrhizobium sp. LM2.7]
MGVEQKVAIITGASQGIGAALVKSYRDSRKATLARFLKRASGGGPQEDEVERRLAA